MSSWLKAPYRFPIHLRLPLIVRRYVDLSPDTVLFAWLVLHELSIQFLIIIRLTSFHIPPSALRLRVLLVRVISGRLSVLTWIGGLGTLSRIGIIILSFAFTGYDVDEEIEHVGKGNCGCHI